MTEIKTLLWLEWKKNSSIVSAMGVVTAIVLMVFLLGGAVSTSQEIISIFFVSIFAYCLGIAFLVLISYRLGNDFKSDEFAFLLMSPIEPWKHIIARFIFAVGTLSIYFIAISILLISFFAKFWVGEISSYIYTVMVIGVEHFTLAIIPLIAVVLLSSMVIATYNKRSQMLVKLVLLGTLGFYYGHNFKPLMNLNGKVFPEIRLDYADSIQLDPAIVAELLKDGKITWNKKEKTDDEKNDGFYLRSNKGELEANLKFDTQLPVLIEPQLLMIFLSAMFLLLAIRIWDEVEL